MIRSFRHKGLKELFETGGTSRIQNTFHQRCQRRLDALDRARRPEDMNIPGFRLHELKGQRRETWSITVSRNQRITFVFVDGHAYDVDLEDYH